MKKHEQKIKYSEVLQDYAAPLLDKNDSANVFLERLKVAELIWNYCIAKEFKLPCLNILQNAIDSSNSEYPEMLDVFHLMTEIKERDFKQYKNFIINTEYRIKPDGSKTIYVESAEPEALKNISYE